MSMWVIFSIAVATVVVALLLAYVLKSRLNDDDVWEELVDPGVSDQDSQESPSHSDSRPSLGFRESPPSRGEPLEAPTPLHSSRTRQEVDLRRSSRIEQTISLMVLGINRRGESFQEKTSAVSLNLHGCRYSSRHDYPLEGWVTLQVTGTDSANSSSVRARVRSILSPQTPRELCQVGVELETPGNVWGIPAPPEDWQRILGTSKPSMVAAAAATLDSSEAEDSLFETPPAAPERRAEVTVFPGPSTPPPVETSVSKEPAVQKTERVVLTPDQLLQALQGKVQQAADRAVQNAIAAHLDESVNNAIGKIDEVWKSNVRQSEEFSAVRLAEVQNRWEKDLAVYRTRAEETARRLEAMTATTQQAFAESQKTAERIKNELEPELYARVNQTFAKANSDFDSRASQVSERHLATLAQSALNAAREARSRLDESAAEIRSLLGTAPAPGVSEERIASFVDSSQEQTLNRMEERLAEVSRQFEQQQDATRRRTDELAQRLENFAAILREAQSQHVQSIAEIRSLLSTADHGISEETLDSQVRSVREQLHNHLEWRLGEFSGRNDQQFNLMRQQSEELAQRLSTLATESRDTRSQQEQSVADLRALLSSTTGGVSQERLDWLLNSAREQVLNHFETRLGEVARRSEQQHDVSRQRSDEVVQRLDKLTFDTRVQFEEFKKLAERAPREAQPVDFAASEQTADRVAKEFETVAARVSDRQLTRLVEQKQALARETALELEARASEARALLEKAANSTLDEFRRRLEVQIDLITSEATERVTSALSSLDKESRAAIDARRRAVETEVARAAEQSATEFRSGIKAFLYSCLVAAVSAVDQHAQNTLAGLEKDPSGASAALTLDATANSSSKSEGFSSAANASSSSTDHRG
jgi:hypothetical protein